MGKEFTMNKMFFGLRCSLLLLLCALLACCSQDEEGLAPTAKLVPLDISAVIEGAGTRGDATEKTAFEDGDEISITIDGDDSGKSYIYVYNDSEWAPKDNDNDNDNRLLISEDVTAINITAKYSEDDGNNSITSKINDLAATATVGYTNTKADFKFTHVACKLQINIYCFDGTTPKGAKITVSEGQNEVISSNATSDDYTINVYIPETATEANVTLGNKKYKIALSNLEVGKTYSCNIYTKFMNKMDASLCDVYLEDGTAARIVIDPYERKLDPVKVSALKAYAKLKGISVLGIEFRDEYDDRGYLTLKDYVRDDGTYLFSPDEIPDKTANESGLYSLMRDNSFRDIIKAFDGDLPEEDNTPYYWVYKGDKTMFLEYFNSNTKWKNTIYPDDNGDYDNSFLVRFRETIMF